MSFVIEPPVQASAAVAGSAERFPVAASGYLERGRIWLKVNDELRQDGDLAQLIWKVDETIAYLSRLFTLTPGDLIFTGTPEGIAAVEPGDRLEGGIDSLESLRLSYLS